MTTVAQKHPIFGWLKHPRDLEVDGKVISEVVRITGDSRWGFLYEFRKDGKFLKTCEPLWHNEHAHRKRNDLPRFNQEVEVRHHGRVIVKEFTGFGWWKANTAEGKRVAFHFFDMIKGG